ncbi:MAG: hypothetical protein WD021_10360 [Rhodothermales bacterium]
MGVVTIQDTDFLLDPYPDINSRRGASIRRAVAVLFTVLFTVLAAVGTSRAQSALADRLMDRGFENVRVRTLPDTESDRRLGPQSGPLPGTPSDTLLLSFEYRMARGSHAGACEALELAGSGYAHVVTILEHQNVPMTAVAFDGAPRSRPDLLADPAISGRADSSSVRRGPVALDAQVAAQVPQRCGGYRIAGASMDVRPYVRQLESGHHASRPLIDVALHPRYSALFGFYRDPVMLQVNLAPRLNVRLWRGFEVGAQIVVPLYNEFSSEGDFIRPGHLTASQFIRLPGPTFVRATAGTYTNRRFGLDLRARRFFADGRFWAGFDVGRTGNVFYPNGSVFVERDPEWIVLGTAGFAWSRHHLYVDGAAGRFLFGDAGGRVEIMRQFRRLDLGFVFTQTVNGANAGLRLILPLFEGSFAGSRSLRVRPAHDFTWDYLYRAGTNVGEAYETGYYMDRVYRQHQPSFLMDLLTTP